MAAAAELPPPTRGNHPGSRVDSLCAHCCVGHAESSPVTVTLQARANRPMASTHLKLLRAPGLGKWAAACATDSAGFLLSPQKGLLANTGLLAPLPTRQPLAQLPPEMRPNCFVERSSCEDWATGSVNGSGPGGRQSWRRRREGSGSGGCVPHRRLLRQMDYFELKTVRMQQGTENTDLSPNDIEGLGWGSRSEGELFPAVNSDLSRGAKFCESPALPRPCLSSGWHRSLSRLASPWGSCPYGSLVRNETFLPFICHLAHQTNQRTSRVERKTPPATLNTEATAPTRTMKKQRNRGVLGSETPERSRLCTLRVLPRGVLRSGPSLLPVTDEPQKKYGGILPCRRAWPRSVASAGKEPGESK